jgi:hypothetical protein
MGEILMMEMGYWQGEENVWLNIFMNMSKVYRPTSSQENIVQLPGLLCEVCSCHNHHHGQQAVIMERYVQLLMGFVNNLVFEGN